MAEPGASCTGGSNCASGFCILHSAGNFCTVPLCTSDADCSSTRCKSFTIGTVTRKYCIAESKTWCNLP